ncbi:MAG: UDP-N-acetylmuramoyl-L-alanyl-D-glutamate--2,6-diaminopimelate ligase [Candidatus Hydrogenedentes bacterium]|nr:UDP-N-acetylmuramoyl-L-alanyl-D-glutamate--2,6-diaminopimelate ligase [Candidatus Hydrogenedentota bacterium]
MKLHDALEAIGFHADACPAVEAAGVTEDSRKVSRGDVFVAVMGGHADGHDFAASAAASGAVAVLGDRPGLRELAGLPYLYAPAVRETAARLAHRLAGDPTERLTVIGITGTNGKSSTAMLARAMLQESGRATSLFGTLGYDIGNTHVPAPHTTPFGDELARMMQRAIEAGDTHVVMEVSSHALDQERVAGIRFRGAAFTNLTQDHLDYHVSMEAYRDAKLKLFRRVEGEGAFTAINREDPASPAFLEASAGRTIAYGEGGAIRARSVKHGAGGSRFTLETPDGQADVALRLIGEHNVQNALCAAAIGHGLGLDPGAIARGLGRLDRVPGRFDAVDGGQDFFVIVDYAHTEDGLVNVLRAARPLCRGRIITVFGCGGDRDRGKRPKMGRAAGQLSDFCVLTSDNPRSEDPCRILLDVEVGLQRAGRKKGEDYVVIESREKAIHHAIGLARPGDLVMIAGKGHEDYQILADRTIHFDDREVALEALGGLR